MMIPHVGQVPIHHIGRGRDRPFGRSGVHSHVACLAVGQFPDQAWAPLPVAAIPGAAGLAPCDVGGSPIRGR